MMFESLKSWPKLAHDSRVQLLRCTPLQRSRIPDRAPSVEFQFARSHRGLARRLERAL